MKTRNQLAVVTLILATVLSGCSSKPERLILTGSVEGKNYDVVAQASGTVTAIYAAEGDEINIQKQLAQIDDRELKLKRDNLELLRQITELKYQDLKNGNSKSLIRQAIANRDQIKAQLSGSQKEIDYLNGQLNDTKGLLASGASTKQQETELRRALDKELSRQQTLKEQLKSAQEGLNLTLEGAVTEQLKQGLLEIQIKNNEIAQMDLMIEKTKAIAPQNGIVQSANYEVGESVIAGQKMFSIIDPSVLELKVFVNERNLSLVKPHMQVAITGDYSADKPIAGIVDYIATEAEFTPKNIESKESKQEMVYEVRIRIQDNSGLIKPGMYLDADFGVDENEQ